MTQHKGEPFTFADFITKNRKENQKGRDKMFRGPHNGDITTPLSEGNVPPSPFRCMNCNVPFAHHIPSQLSGNGEYCPGEAIHVVVFPKTPHPPCDCRTTDKKPLFPGQLHDPDCYLRDPVKLAEYYAYLNEHSSNEEGFVPVSISQ